MSTITHALVSVKGTKNDSRSVSFTNTVAKHHQHHRQTHRHALERWSYITAHHHCPSTRSIFIDGKQRIYHLISNKSVALKIGRELSVCVSAVNWRGWSEMDMLLKNHTLLAHNPPKNDSWLRNPLLSSVSITYPLIPTLASVSLLALKPISSPAFVYPLTSSWVRQIQND